jgi:hypothetical protein
MARWICFFLALFDPAEPDSLRGVFLNGGWRVAAAQKGGRFSFSIGLLRDADGLQKTKDLLASIDQTK